MVRKSGGPGILRDSTKVRRHNGGKFRSTDVYGRLDGIEDVCDIDGEKGGTMGSE